MLNPAQAVPDTSQGIVEFERPGTEPAGIAASGASLWFTKHLTNTVEQISLSGARLAEFPTGAKPSGITFGPDGALWLTELDGNRIGRLTTCGGYTAFTVPQPASDPSDIVTGPDGALWFTEFANTANKIGRIQAGSSSDCGGGGGGGGGGPHHRHLAIWHRQRAVTERLAALVPRREGGRIDLRKGGRQGDLPPVGGRIGEVHRPEGEHRPQEGQEVRQTDEAQPQGQEVQALQGRAGQLHPQGQGRQQLLQVHRPRRRQVAEARKYRLVATAGSSKSGVKQTSFKIVRR